MPSIPVFPTLASSYLMRGINKVELHRKRPPLKNRVLVNFLGERILLALIAENINANINDLMGIDMADFHGRPLF